VKINIKKIIQAILFLAVGVTLLYIVYRVNDKNYQAQCVQDNIPAEECDLLQKLFTDFQTVDWWWMIPIFACFMMSNISRAIRWRMLIEPLGKKPSMFNMFFSIMLSYFANMGFPRIGEFVRAGVIAKYEDLPVEKVMGTVILDRIADLIVFLLLCGTVAIFQWDNVMSMLSGGEEVQIGGLGTKVIILGALVIVGILVLRFIIKSTSKNKIIVKIQKIILGFWDGIKTISEIKRVGWFIFHSLMIWIMFFLMTYMGFNVFEPTKGLSLEAGLTVFVFGALGFVIPSPGGMGTYHFFIGEALKLYGVPAADGFSFANILFFALQIGCNATLGIVALILLPIVNKQKRAKSA